MKIETVDFFYLSMPVIRDVGDGSQDALLVDAGKVWGDEVVSAERRLPALQSCRAVWLEEPFVSGALEAYQRLARRSGSVRVGGTVIFQSSPARI